ncbi:flagellar protein FlhE [Brenneria izadpanahii]|uniref:Flagellar protein FlhE n=1 Tax=Brenneria izadpanahii TaxID=2722756 RepID=A0ABX7UQG3_9GAMM|nr:flagellar protein FlhE [Brenneria izadpanahii]QTF07963.1 flagellar protein FlhE [Brenneria izadpanahii]
MMEGVRDIAVVDAVMRKCLGYLKHRRYVVHGILAVPFLFTIDGVAAKERGGSWSDEGKQWVLSQRGRPAASFVFSAAEKLPQSARITSVHWQYTLTRKAFPSGLKVLLCTSIRCMELPGGKGTSLAFTGDWAGDEFYFSFSLPGKGPIKPPIRVLNSQLIVNYQY